MGNYCLPRIIPCNQLSAGNNQRSNSRTAWKKSFGAFKINHYQWSTLTENHDTWHLTTKHVSAFENCFSAALKDKRYWRRNCDTIPSSPDQTFSRESAQKIVSKVLDCKIVVCKFELQSYYYVHFWANALGKSMKPSYSPRYRLNSTPYYSSTRMVLALINPRWLICQ